MLTTDNLETLCDICGKPIKYDQAISVSIMDCTYCFPQLAMKNYHKDCLCNSTKTLKELMKGDN